MFRKTSPEQILLIMEHTEDPLPVPLPLALEFRDASGQVREDLRIARFAVEWWRGERLAGRSGLSGLEASVHAVAGAMAAAACGLAASEGSREADFLSRFLLSGTGTDGLLGRPAGVRGASRVSQFGLQVLELAGEPLDHVHLMPH